MTLSVVDDDYISSDDDLLLAYKQTGDLQLLGSLYNRHMEMVFGLCLKYLESSDDAQDAVMDIFELLVVKLRNHEVTYFKSWLYRVASNHCLDILRKKGREIKKEKEIHRMYFDENERLPFDEDGKEEQLTKLDACIEELKLEQKQCVDMFYIKKMSYQEVSDALQISWAETRSYIQNARRNLKICIEQK